MRVTQSMLSNNFLRNISKSYEELGKLQDQLATQKKITRLSDDPVVAMLGLGYRTNLNQVQQFTRNIGEVNNWLESTDDAISHGVNVLQRIRELTIQAANDTYEGNQRSAIAVEMRQLKEQLQTIAETQVGGKYIFNGTNTNHPPVGGEFSSGVIKIEIFDGITISVNTNGNELFGDILKDDESSFLTRLIEVLENPEATGDDVREYIGKVDEAIDRFLKEQANVGAKLNRVEMMEDRLSSQEVIASKILSENEDVEIEKVITELITQESVHRAALSVGARIIQPTLVDFLR